MGGRTGALLIAGCALTSVLLLALARGRSDEIAGRMQLVPPPSRTALMRKAPLRVRFRFRAAAPIAAGAAQDASGLRLYVGDTAGNFYVLDAHGRALARQNLGSPVWASPLVSPVGDVFVGTSRGELHVLDERGEPRVSLPLAGPVEVAPSWCPQGFALVSAGRELVAVEPTGQVQFRFRAWDKIATTARCAGELVFVGAQDDRLYALAGGKELWSYPAQADVNGSPLADARGVWFGSDQGVVVSLAPDGTRRWTQQLFGYLRAPLVWAPDGSLVAATFGPRPRAVWLDSDTGAVRAVLPLPFLDTSELGIAAAPVFSPAGNVYVSGADGRLYSGDRHGRLLWSFEVLGDLVGAPLRLSDGALVVTSRDGTVLGLEETGSGDDPAGTTRGERAR